MDKFKAIVVDDEVNNLELMEHLINSYCPAIEIVAKCDDFHSACSEILKYDNIILFLDIELGSNQNGIDIMEIIGRKNMQIIVVSAYADFAIDSFKYNVTDYILKPVKIVDLTRAVDRAVKNLKMTTSLFQEPTHPSLAPQLQLKLRNKTLFLQPDDIVYIESANLNCYISVGSGDRHVSNQRIGEIEGLLDVSMFTRVHKSFIINNSKISEIDYCKDLFTIIMSNGVKIPVSRRRKTLVRKLMKAE